MDLLEDKATGALGGASRMDVTAAGPTTAAVAKTIWAMHGDRFDRRAVLFDSLVEAA